MRGLSHKRQLPSRKIVLWAAYASRALPIYYDVIFRFLSQKLTLLPEESRNAATVMKIERNGDKMKMFADAMMSFTYGLTAMLTMGCVWMLMHAIGRCAVIVIKIAKNDPD